MLVLDSSAFFSMDALPEEEHVCPPGVIRELEKYEDPRLALWGDMVHVSDCSKESLAKVEEAARKSGDLGRLSPVDMTVLALALDVNGTIWSDDYSIQNVARIMGIWSNGTTSASAAGSGTRRRCPSAPSAARR